MGPRRTIDYEGKKATGQPLEFEAKAEAWNKYVLEDGSLLKIRVVLLDVIRVEGVYKDGNPVYQFAAQQIVAIQPPEELREQKGKAN